MPEEADRKPRLLIISHVLPFPGVSGQQQRVAHILRALRTTFHVTFLSAVSASHIDSTKATLLEYCDAVRLLPSLYQKGRVRKLLRRLGGLLFMLRTGLKFSNYRIGEVEFSPARIAQLEGLEEFDFVLYEYWHAWKSAAVFRHRGVPCGLDMHNILWQAYARQMEAKPLAPAWWKHWALAKYKEQEEQAWEAFEVLIAINAAECTYVNDRVPDDLRVFLTPMGIDLTWWPDSWRPAHPPRVAYYGGLGSPHNQQDALACYEEVMPHIWQHLPEAELWIVGSNPPDRLRLLAETDPRVTVTGYVEQVQALLNQMAVVVCPWSGTYGFRSRLIEVMALGVPLIASPEAAYGMGLKEGQGILFKASYTEMAQACLALLQDHNFAQAQSKCARLQVEDSFSYTATYLELAKDLRAYLQQHRLEGSSGTAA